MLCLAKCRVLRSKYRCCSAFWQLLSGHLLLDTDTPEQKWPKDRCQQAEAASQKSQYLMFGLMHQYVILHKSLSLAIKLKWELKKQISNATHIWNNVFFYLSAVSLLGQFARGYWFVILFLLINEQWILSWVHEAGACILVFSQYNF